MFLLRESSYVYPADFLKLYRFRKGIVLLYDAKTEFIFYNKEGSHLTCTTLNKRVLASRHTKEKLYA